MADTWIPIRLGQGVKNVDNSDPLMCDINFTQIKGKIRVNLMVSDIGFINVFPNNIVKIPCLRNRISPSFIYIDKRGEVTIDPSSDASFILSSCLFEEKTLLK